MKINLFATSSYEVNEVLIFVCAFQLEEPYFFVEVIVFLKAVSLIIISLLNILKYNKL